MRPAASCRRTFPSPPTYRKVNPADPPDPASLGVTSDALPLTEVDDYAENMLAQHISQIPGVAQVNVGGQQKPAVRIQVDPAKIAASGSRSRTCAPCSPTPPPTARKARSTAATRTFTIYANDQLLAAEPWNDAIVAYQNGAPVRVRDIGRAVDGPENTKLAAWPTASAAIILAVLKQPGANVIETVDRIKAALPQLQAAIPPAIKVDILSDRTQTIRASVADVQFTLVLTIALVVMVIFAVPAQPARDHDPERHRAAGARRHLRRDVRCSATASTICR